MIKFFIISLLIIVCSIMIVRGQVSSTESSAEYLHNVMNQLQEHNRPADRTTDLTYFKNQQHHNKPQQGTDKAFYDYHGYIDGNKQQLVTERSIAAIEDQQFAESASHYQIQAPQKALKPVQVIKEPAAPLGLTRNDLALLYKRALQQGSPVSLSSVKNSLSSSYQIPQITGVTPNQVPSNPGNPGFYYYFYPLKSFINELQDNRGSKPVNHAVRPQHSDLSAESSEKQVANPLFMAISGFIGMALMFMASVLFVPKFENFASRNSSNDFLQLSKVAWEAIEGRDCTERFACELNKVATKMELSKRSRRLFEDVLPDNLRRQMIRMRKTKKKRQECKSIQCKCA